MKKEKQKSDIFFWYNKSKKKKPAQNDGKAHLIIGSSSWRLGDDANQLDRVETHNSSNSSRMKAKSALLMLLNVLIKGFSKRFSFI